MFINHETGDSKSRLDWVVMQTKVLLYFVMPDKINRNFLKWWLKAKGEGMAEDEMISWYHQLSGHESEQTLGDGKGQASLECCSL